METINKCINPFSTNRREGEDKSKIYLSYSDALNWFSSSNFLFEGNRGSGKTSILSAFNYENVWLNNTLIIPDQTLRYLYEGKPTFLGALYKCEIQENSTWEKWSFIHGKDNAEIIYTTYMNFYFSEKFIEAVEVILKEKSQFVNQEDKELYFIDSVLEKAFPIEDKRPKLFDYSLHRLKLIFKDIHNKIRQNIIYGVSLEDICKTICIHENCSLIAEVCLLIQKSFHTFSDVLFFPLIDDINRLKKWQTKCINSMVLAYRSPISFKMSSVLGLLKTRDTRDEERPLGNSDMNIIPLGYDEDDTKISKQKDISELLTIIFNSRIKTVYPNVSDLDLNKIFGKSPDLNTLLLNTLKKSEKKDVLDLINEYEKSGEKYITDFWIQKHSLKTLEAESESNKLSARRNESAVYKKMRQACTFSIINQYNLGGNFEYSTVDIIKHLICGSIRRFLKICEFLWEEMKLQIEEKGTILKISSKLQSKAIRNSADYVYNGIDDRPLRETIDTSCRKICDRLSNIFLSFISLDSLKITTECLSLRIPKKDLDKATLGLIDSIVLFEAFIKIDDGDYFKIGLHPTLSPKFHLPYRSPFYYSETISSSDFRNIIAFSENDMKGLYKKLYNKRIGLDYERTLFDN